MAMQARGEFDVKRSAEPPCDLGDGVQAGHFRFGRRFHGALDATGVVHMLAFVAIDIVDGKHFYTFDYALPDA